MTEGAAVADRVAVSADPVESYRRFVEAKSQIGHQSGFDPTWMPGSLFDFQLALVEWATRKGRAAIFADTGLGKTAMQLAWAENVVRRENKPVLLLTPLGVSAQTVREAEKFGVDCVRSRDGKFSGSRVVVTNYERIHHFDPSDFAGVVCDESSAIKNFDGSRTQAITEFMKPMRFRILCTATASPNDYIELGTSSEALGELGRMDMLSRFFKNDSKTLHIMGTKHGAFTRDKWRFKQHAERHFWRWVCSWARAVRKPSDLGFDDSRFVLPPLTTRETIVKADRPRGGLLFDLPAENLRDQREERRLTLDKRCEAVARLVDHGSPAVAWCHLNDEGDLLERIIPDARQVSGSMSDDEKEDLFLAFSSGQLRVMVIKPVIGAFGLNWQHCAHMTFFPAHSFEQYYQGVRRCHRFGQTRPVVVDVVTSEGEADVVRNLQRKAEQAEKMFTSLVAEMNDAMKIDRATGFPNPTEVPSWL